MFNLLTGKQNGRVRRPNEYNEAIVAKVTSDTASTAEVTICLDISSRIMSIPKEQSRILVGREDHVRKASEALGNGKDGARVVLTGMQGAGKDEIAARVVRDERVLRCQEIMFAEWIQGSTASLLRVQLLGAFHAQIPHIFSDSDGEDKSFERVREWLTKNTGWFFVIEDATSETLRILPDLFPEGRGRLLITTQMNREVSLLKLWNP